MEIKPFKIRASQLSKIMGKPRDSGGLTDTQAKNLATLEAKEKRTEKQEQTMLELIAKRDKPEGLSAGAKTYVQGCLKEQLYGRRKEISSKYTQKGNEQEDASIHLLNMYLLESYEKNEEYRENTEIGICGTPDIVAPDLIRDIKTSWDFSTFPLFETSLNQDYYYQAQAYMILFDCNHASVDYCLVNTPDYLIEKEAHSLARDKQISFLEALQHVVPLHIYDETERWNKEDFPNIKTDIPLNLRVKSFSVVRDPKLENRIEQKVKLCREDEKELLEGVK